MVDMNELNNAKNKMKREISMYKQTLKNLRDFLTNTTFSQFCEIVYPDFKQDESTGYLKSKYSLFQQNFGFFLSELDEKRLGRFASAIPEESVSGVTKITDDSASKCKNDPGIRPECGNENVNFGDVEFQAATNYRDCGCNECGCRWNEIYKFHKKEIQEGQ